MTDPTTNDIAQAIKRRRVAMEGALRDFVSAYADLCNKVASVDHIPISMRRAYSAARRALGESE
jgi:hypothetical protein